MRVAVIALCLGSLSARMAVGQVSGTPTGGFSDPRDDMRGTGAQGSGSAVPNGSSGAMTQMDQGATDGSFGTRTQDYRNQDYRNLDGRAQDARTPDNRTQDGRMLDSADHRSPTNLTPPLPPLTEFQQVVLTSTGRVIPIFGQDLFNTPPSTFAPVDNIPVTPDYVIGPGDELRLQVWGQVNLRGSYIVDRTGAISLPEVGTIHVAGLRFSQLNDFVRAQLGRVYRNYDLNINLGQLRSIQVFVVGRVKKPGSYTIGSLSTLLNALFASGGPSPQGGLRDIQVKRDGETITHFDLYDLLLRGDKTKDVRLVSGDVIFIPDAGPQVAVVGSVSSPAIFELRAETSFKDAIALAGGLNTVASHTRVQVERILNHTERSLLDLDATSETTQVVRDGDLINVRPINERFADAVTLRGNVANPGRYVWHEGMRVSDLIPDRESLITRDYYQRQNALARGTLAGSGPMEGSLGTDPGVATPGSAVGTTSGRGLQAASAATSRSGTSFRAQTEVILTAPDIDWAYAVIERQSATDLKTSLLPFALGKVVLEKDASQDLVLMKGDVVTIFSTADLRVPSNQQTKFVKLEGEFAGAGVYSVQPDETLRHLLTRAGGLTPDAFLFASMFTRESVRQQQRQRLQDYVDSIESEIAAETSAAAASALSERDVVSTQASAAESRNALARLREAQPTGRIILQLKPESRGVESIPDIALEDGDRFIVPKLPTTVDVFGQVYSANAFLFQPNRKVRDYLQLAGGADRLADAKRSFLVRADGSVISRQYANARHFGDFDHLAILPGDTIVVPRKYAKRSFLPEAANIATIIQGFGIAAAAIQVLR